MGLFDKKLSLNALKGAVTDAALKVSDTVQNIDVANAVSSTKQTVLQITEKAVDASQAAYEIAREKAAVTYTSVSEEVRNFDYEQLRDTDYIKDRYSHYRDLSAAKVTEYFNSAFEIDKPTMQMVDDVRRRLPVPVSAVDEIFDQCKREAIRRAIASFGLGTLVSEMDNQSAEKYSNLSENYQTFLRREEYSIKSHQNYAAMTTGRKDAIKGEGTFAQVENGYNKGSPLFAIDADVEHVIAKKEIYDDLLLRIGTTDRELIDVINAKENLVFASGSFNSSLKDKDIFEYLDRRGTPDPNNPDILYVTILSTKDDGATCEPTTVAISKKDVEDAYAIAEAKRNEHRIDAAIEVGVTIIKSGTTMAVQQVVGLIVVETIDIFIDEIKSFTLSGKVVNADGWIQSTKDATERIRQRLSARFEERQIWTRAKELGIEAGVSGALSVIPQILISFVVKLPSYMLAIIREATLSVVRCVRVLASDDGNKLDSIKIIFAGSASAIIGVYVSRIISNAIGAVPLLDKFNAQIANVLTGLLVTAVPLAAIYAFDQNKHKLIFIASSFKSDQTKGSPT